MTHFASPGVPLDAPGSRGRLRGLSKLFRAPIYWAHRAVVFAIARLSCYYVNLNRRILKYVVSLSQVNVFALNLEWA